MDSSRESSARKKHASEKVLLAASALLVAAIVLLCLSQAGYEKAQEERALLSAVANRRIEEVRLLLAQGVDPNTTAAGPTTVGDSLKRVCETAIHPGSSFEKQPPIIAAMIRNYDDVTELLVQQGADVNTDWRGMRPLLIATKHGNARLMHLLLRQGAEVDGTGPSGETALIEAAGSIGYSYLPHYSSPEECTRILLAHGAKVNVVDEYGRTPLLEAVEAGNLAMVRLLIQHGANINYRNKHGATPLRQAMRMKSQAFLSGWTDQYKQSHKAIVAVLQQAGAKA